MLGSGSTVARHVHSAILAKLRPAESAVRRLIAVAARGLVVTPGAKRAGPVGPVPKGSGEAVPPFALFDRRRRVGPFEKRVPGHGPGVRGLDGLDPAPPASRAPLPDDPVAVARVSQRIAALRHALDTIDAQARRMVRGMARRGIRPMRPGRPPGHVERGKREIDIVLAECHLLALYAFEVPVVDSG